MVDLIVLPKRGIKNLSTPYLFLSFIEGLSYLA